MIQARVAISSLYYRGVIDLATFFIVDDELMLHELYRDILEIKGHKVVGQAFNGKECMERIKNMIANPCICPDFIIMDHRMPFKNGLEVTRELLKENPELKILFVSADDSIEKEAVSLGAIKFIKKPFSIQRMMSILDEISIT